MVMLEKATEVMMGMFGIQDRNAEGQMVVDFAKSIETVVVNTFFQKRQDYRVSRSTQVDYILFRRCNLKEISDCKVGESVAGQYRMVVWRMTLVVRKRKRTEAEQRCGGVVFRLLCVVMRCFQMTGQP